MKRTNAPPIPEGLRIKLNGEQEWKDVMQVFEDAGWVWINGDKPTALVEEYSKDKEEMNMPVVITERFNQLSRGSVHEDELTATEFLQQYQSTIEYEVGDWVVILKDQSGDPVGTITQVVHVEDFDSVYVKNITKPHSSIPNWSAGVDKIRPATPEEIASVTKVVPKDPDVYIWDGDVLPDEYWVENPNRATCEVAKYLKMLPGGEHWNGNGRWYKIMPEDIESHKHKGKDDLPIVSYELWKSILEQPNPQAEPAVPKWSIVTTDGVRVYEGDPSWWLDKEVKEHRNKQYNPTKITKNHKGSVRAGYLLFSTFEAAEEYISKQKQSAGRRWKVGDRYCNPNDLECDRNEQPNTVGWYIRQLSKDNYKVETADGKDRMRRYSYTAKNIDDYVNRRIWVPYVEKKESTVKEMWKVGDILPSEWLNSVEDFRTYKGKSRGSGNKYYSSHRVVEQVKEGWALISETNDLWLAPKDQYPTYLTESTVKENIVSIGWKPGDSWRHKNNGCGLSISVHPKDGDSNMYFIDYGKDGTAWRTVEEINRFVREGKWIINPDQKSKQEQKSQTIINKQTKTKQNEKGNSISITEQCIVINSNYINCKTSNATYVPGDEERITKGQRRQGSTVRG